MKNTKNIIIIIGALLIIGYIFFNNFNSLETDDIQIDTNQDKIDYSLLEKDLLYSEEEGEYENLSNDGKKLLEDVLILPECINNPTSDYCYDNQQMVTRSSILSLKDKFLLLSFPTVKGPQYSVYDLRDYASTNNSKKISGNVIKNDKVIIFVQEKNILYYKPGMNNVKIIEGSTLQGSYTYAELYGMINTVDVSFFDDNSIKASIFDENQLLPEEPYKPRLHKKVEEKILIIE